MERSLLELERPFGDAISRIRFAPGSNNLLISSWDSILRLYDVDGLVLRLGALADGALLDCCFADEMVAMSVGSDGCIRRYDLYSGTQSTVRRHDDCLTCIEYSEETAMVATACLDKTLLFWDMRSKTGNIECKQRVDSEVWSISLCGYFLLAGSGTTVDLYDLRNLKDKVQSTESSLDHQIQCVRSSSNCDGLAVGSIDGRVALKFLDSCKESERGCVFRCHPKLKDGRHHLAAVNDIMFHPSHDTFITGDNEGYAIIWDAQSRKRLFEFDRCCSSVSSLSYNRSGQLLAVASSYTYQEANEVEEDPQIWIHKINEKLFRPNSSE